VGLYFGLNPAGVRQGGVAMNPLKRIDGLYRRIGRLLVPIGTCLVLLAIVVYVLDVWLW
jgi:hypothetical protein